MRKKKVTISIDSLKNRDYPIIRPGISGEISNIDGCPIPPIPTDFSEYINVNEKFGKIDKSFVYIDLLFTSNMTNVGSFTTEDFVEAITLINEVPDIINRRSGLPIENYYTTESYWISGLTEPQLDQFISYNQNSNYIVGLNYADEPSIMFSGVIDITSDFIEYVIGGMVNNTGQYISETGVIYKTYNFNRLVEDRLGIMVEIPYTEFKYKALGIKSYNSSLNALIHEDVRLGVSEVPRVQEDIFIDRGTVSVKENHLRMAEISSLGQLQQYGNGYFNIVRT
jgi:hypothetical protein